GLAVLAFVAIVALSEARFWPSPGNLWLAAAIGGAALVWWQMSPRSSTQPPPAGGTVTAAPLRRPLFPLAAGGLLVVVGTVALVDLLGAWNADWRIVLGALVVATGGLVAAGAATGRSGAGAGEVVIFGHSDDGTSIHDHVRDPGVASARLLVVDAHVGVGRLEVVRG